MARGSELTQKKPTNPISASLSNGGTAERRPLGWYREKAAQIRQHIVKTVYRSGNGHSGGALSAVEILVGLYYHQMRFDPQQPLWTCRDRFVLSKGHACVSQYSILADLGFFDLSELDGFRHATGRLEGHPEYGIPGIETATGSLGQGFSIAGGMALGLRHQDSDSRVYCLLGDGESQEGIVWEAAMSAGNFHLANFTAVTDYNRLQQDGPLEGIMPLDSLEDKWRAFNWAVRTIDGHDIEQVLEALAWAASVSNKPQMIIANTIKGKGVSFMENVPKWHGTKPPSDEQFVQAIGELKQQELQ